MNAIATFWNGDHQLSAASNELTDKLMPAQGACDTLQGELLRATNKISWDWFNNGWGCNNWSGAVVFLKNNFGKLPVQPESTVLRDLERALSYVHEYSHGEPARHLHNDRLSAEVDGIVTRIHEIVVQAILDNSEPIANSDDMWNHREPDARWEEEDHNDDDEGDDE